MNENKNERQNSGVIIIVLLLILGISIGFAAVSSLLNIQGDAVVKPNRWDIHFENIQVDENSEEAVVPATIKSTTSIEFDTVLDIPGEYYQFNVDVVNGGTIDAMVDSIIKLPELTEKQKEYITYTITYVDGTEIKEKDLLKKGEKVTLKFLIKYRDDMAALDLPMDYVDNISARFDMIYVQAKNNK